MVDALETAAAQIDRIHKDDALKEDAPKEPAVGEARAVGETKSTCAKDAGGGARAAPRRRRRLRLVGAWAEETRCASAPRLAPSQSGSALHRGPGGAGKRCSFEDVVCARVGRDRFIEGGYASEHYVSAPPDTHALCYELRRLVAPSQTGGIGGGGGGTAAPGEGEEEEVNGPKWEPVAFAAFGVYAVGGSMPWLPFGNKAPNNGKYDISQLDRLVVLPAFRGSGAKELLLELAGRAFHRLGLPLRVKTASPVAHASFLKCPLLAHEGKRGRGKCGTGRGSKEGWVHWYVGAPVIDPYTRRPFCFVTREEPPEEP